MSADEVYLYDMKKLEPIKVMQHWVRERELIRQKKIVQREGTVLTDDPILRAWRFCNVRREDDRVTVWIRKNIRERFAGHRHLWFMLCAARQINWPETLDDLIESPRAWPDDTDFHPSEMTNIMDRRAERGLKVFTGAYIITAPQTKGERKSKFVAEVTLGALWKERRRLEDFLQGPWEKGYGPNLAGMHHLLMRFNGWGPFLAYQAVVDMRFTPLLSGANDVASWVACGPGTVRGLNRWRDRRLEASVHETVSRNEVRELWPMLKDETGVEMDLSDVPNVLCEFDKYCRVLYGQGEPRAKYVHGRGY